MLRVYYKLALTKSLLAILLIINIKANSYNIYFFIILINN